MKKKRFLLLGLLLGLIVFAFGVASASAEVTWNPDHKSNGMTLSNGNLTNSSTGYVEWTVATESKSTGKYYFELTLSDTMGSIGISNTNDLSAIGHGCLGMAGIADSSIGYYISDGSLGKGGIYVGGSHKSFSGDIVGVAIDADNKNIKWYRNNTLIHDQNYTFNGPIYAATTGVGTYNATVNFGTTPFAHSGNAPAGYLAYNGSVINPTATKTLDITAVDTAKIGDSIVADLVINGASDLYAEDIKVTYDTTLLTYTGYEEVTGLKVYSSSEITPGTLRFIVASQGETNVVNGTKTLVKLKFTAKAAGEAHVDITTGRIADTTQETDVTADQCGEKTITIESLLDVNRSGEFTLLDLAIDAWYHGKTVAQTDSTLYDADVIVDENIDDLDLTEIVNRMLQNTNYAPNNS